MLGLIAEGLREKIGDKFLAHIEDVNFTSFN